MVFSTVPKLFVRKIENKVGKLTVNTLNIQTLPNIRDELQKQKPYRGELKVKKTFLEIDSPTPTTLRRGFTPNTKSPLRAIIGRRRASNREQR
jgi:hypothetical protein